MNNVIRAIYDEKTVIVYQAFNEAIASSALKAQTFIAPPFKKERMTWIKPSFLWMMYRSGWASKLNQDHILSIKIKREGFEWALENACLSHFDKTVYATYEEWKTRLSASPVRIQWDPEKNILLEPLPYKSIQIGLSGVSVDKYLSEWIVGIEDISQHCRSIRQLILAKNLKEAAEKIPPERVLDLPDHICRLIAAS